MARAHARHVQSRNLLGSEALDRSKNREHHDNTFLFVLYEVFFRGDKSAGYEYTTEQHRERVIGSSKNRFRRVNLALYWRGLAHGVEEVVKKPI